MLTDVVKSGGFAQVIGGGTAVVRGKKPTFTASNAKKRQRRDSNRSLWKLDGSACRRSLRKAYPGRGRSLRIQSNSSINAIGTVPSRNPTVKKANLPKAEPILRFFFFSDDPHHHPDMGASPIILLASDTISPSLFFLSYAESERIKYACSKISLSVFLSHTTLFSHPFIIYARFLSIQNIIRT